MARPKASYTFSGIQSLNLSDYGLSLSLVDGDSIEFDVRSERFPSSTCRAIESFHQDGTPKTRKAKTC